MSAGEELKEANERKPSGDMGAGYRASLGSALTTSGDTFQVWANNHPSQICQ